jgi:hypothetical protein
VPTTIVGVTTAGDLVRFDSATPGTLTTIAGVSGLVAGQSLTDIAFRPATGQLYGLAYDSSAFTIQLYTVDPLTAAATAVGSSVTVPGLNSSNGSFGLSFDPVTDRVHVLANGAGVLSAEELTFDPATGAQVGSAVTVSVAFDVFPALANTNPYAGANSTTCYAYDYNFNQLYTFDPATGNLSLVGSSGLSLSLNSQFNLGLDIGSDGVAYLNAVVGGTSGLYTVNLGSGTASLVGTFAGTTMKDIAVAPATQFYVAAFPDMNEVGDSGSFVVIAEDPYGLVAPGYQGTVTFRSSDPAAVVPSNSTLLNGTGVFQATLNTGGLQSLTATDTQLASLTGSQTGIVVSSFWAPPNAVSRPVAMAGLDAQHHFVQAVYLTALGRIGTMPELDCWCNLLNSPGGSPAVVVSDIEHSLEARDRVVRNWYQSYLGRTPVGGEELGWAYQMMAGQTEEQVLSAILGSPEFASRSQALFNAPTAAEGQVQGLYQLVLHRAPVPEEVSVWAGIVPAWGGQTVAQVFLQTAEFRTDLVDRYYDNLLHRPADPAGEANWVNSGLDANTMRLLFEGTPEFYSYG